MNSPAPHVLQDMTKQPITTVFAPKKASSMLMDNAFNVKQDATFALILPHAANVSNRLFFKAETANQVVQTDLLKLVHFVLVVPKIASPAQITSNVITALTTFTFTMEDAMMFAHLEQLLIKT
jgi:hypothetical protein